MPINFVLLKDTIMVDLRVLGKCCHMVFLGQNMSVVGSGSILIVDRCRSPGLGVFSGEGGSKRITTYPVQVRHTLGVGAGS